MVKVKKENKNIQQGTLSAFTLSVFILQSVADLPSEYWQIQRLVKFLKVRTGGIFSPIIDPALTSLNGALNPALLEIVVFRLVTRSQRLSPCAA